MVLAVAALVAALGIGRLAGGSLRRLATLPLRGTWLVGGAVVLQAAGVGAALALDRSAGSAYAAGLAGSAALAGLFLLRNRRLPGIPLATVGLALNAAVVVANGAMPVSLPAAARAGVATGPIAGGEDARHVVADGRTRLRPLGDVVPVPWPGHPEVVSPGDVLLVAGLGLLLVRGMRRADDG